MIEKLSNKDIRAIKIGAVGAAAILIFVFVSNWVDHWTDARNSLNLLNEKLELIDMDKARRDGLMSIVPVFEMPTKEEEQKFLFRDKLAEQLQKARINSGPLQEVASRKSPYPGYKLLCMKCTATCRFSQVLDLLANLKENPYLVGVEEMRLKCDQKKPDQVEMTLTVSTFAK